MDFSAATMKRLAITGLTMVIMTLILFMLVAPTSLADSEVAQNATPAAPPDPAVPTLQAQIEAQATQVAFLEQETDTQLSELRLEIRERDFLRRMTAAVIGGILGVPITAFFVLKHSRKTIKKRIDQAIYRLDPTNATLRVPDRDFDLEENHLRGLGFYDIRPYWTLGSSCVEDCVIVPIEDEEDIVGFRAFLKHHSPDPAMVGYVLYTKQRIPPDIVDDFPNITFSNSIVTLGTNVFTIARSLMCRHPPSDNEQE